MCWCNPSIRTPQCKKVGCHPPAGYVQVKEDVSAPIGWICPVCHKSNAPFSLTCKNRKCNEIPTSD